MLDQYASDALPCYRPAFLRSAAFSCDSARFAHRVAHKGPKRPRAAHGYHRKDGPGGWPVFRLRLLFLAYVTSEYPEARDAFSWADLEQAPAERTDRDLAPELVTIPRDEAVPFPRLHDSLLAWARRYHLATNWVLSGTVEGLDMASRFETRPTLRPGTVANATPAPPPPLTFEAPGYTGDLSPSEDRQRQRAAFDTRLEAHIAYVVKSVEADPSVERESFADRRTKANMRQAAQWQACGGAPDDAKEEKLTANQGTQKDLFYRIGIATRPGLKSPEDSQLP